MSQNCLKAPPAHTGLVIRYLVDINFPRSAVTETADPYPRAGLTLHLISQVSRVRQAGSDVAAAEVVAFLSGIVAKWWLPERVEFLGALPLTATGKINKRALREQFADAAEETGAPVRP